ncbi:hypothetical protein ABZ897_20355 [Nonomuraea sp. NPDC046802]|uniref:hypothetical protein n=1 Tax=Nonomuraea sp. NPDC046802 TaxID=3154919 RepID=UPI003411DA05
MLVLLINDHLLKQSWPGLITGKLSDVAGLVVAPALLALLFWRRADLAATVLTGVLFALVKSTETGAEVASHLWTLVAGPSRVLADPTDLLALPALALAWWVRRRTLHGGSQRRQIIVIMPLAVLAVTATSAAQLPTAHAVEVDGDRIVVRVWNSAGQTSSDGGVTWSQTYEDGTVPVEAPQSAGCVPGQATRCYRVVEGRMAVEQSDDGGKTWGPSWELNGDDFARLTRRYPGLNGRYSMGLGVQAKPGGHVVVVANGLDGILVRDVSGTWRRVGWPGAEVPGLDLTPERNVALLLAACMLFGGIGARLRHYPRVYIGFAAATCLGLYAALNGDLSPFSGSEFWEVGLTWAGLLTTVVGGIVCLVLAFAGRAQPVNAAVGVIGAPLVFATVYLPFVGWSAGTPGAYWVAVAFAVLLTGLVVLGSALLIRKAAPLT